MSQLNKKEILRINLIFQNVSAILNVEFAIFMTKIIVSILPLAYLVIGMILCAIKWY